LRRLSVDGFSEMKKHILFLMVFLVMDGVALALSTYQEVRHSYVKSDSVLLDRHGEVLHELRTDKDRRRLDWTTLSEISSALRETVIQAEDRRFFDHSGVDYLAAAGAVMKGLSSESLRGASTITMQLASFLDKEIQPRRPRKSFWQKGKQVLAAWEIERSWSKPEILEAYLNLVTYRGELQGIMAASRGLFGKDPHGLDRTESLVLASLIRSPNASSAEVSRRASHLNHSIGWDIPIDGIQSKVSQVFLGPLFLRPRMALAPHLARQILKAKPKGSAIPSTLDLKLQQFALGRLAHHLLFLRQQNVRDGALLVIENRTGNVLVYGSYSSEPTHTRYVDGVQAKRQAGSTLKPLLYAHALDRRVLTPASILNDTPLDISVVNGIYQPRNYDSEFKGPVTVRVALASSLNVPAVKTLSLVGNESFLRVLRQAGIRGLREGGDFYGPSLALGSADVSLWELTNAYRLLANRGEWSDLRVVPGEGSPDNGRRVFSMEATFLVSDILSDREARSSTFGLENSLATRFWTAVKTGTSKDMRDNWCIGYSKRYTVGVWVGNFSGDPMWNVSGVAGAAPIWVEVMNFLHRNEPSSDEKPPTNVVSREVELSQGMESGRKEWFIRGTEPHSTDRKIVQLNQRILYPPSGTIMAVDPDIPPEVQKVFFISQTDKEELHWMLNGAVMDGMGKTVSWSPKAGSYFLSMLDREGNVLDSVRFEVRGPAE
jgi:penicillin-binding protein 1C